MAKKKVAQHPLLGVRPKPVAKRRPKRRASPRTTDPFGRWLDARQQWRDLPQDSLRPPETIDAELRLAVVDMLRAHARGAVGLPEEVAFELAEAIEALHAEQETPFLLPQAVRLRHRKRYLSHPFLNECRKDAVRYVLACRRGLLDDDHPGRTMANVFGVDKSTIRRWVAKDVNLEIGNLRTVKLVAIASGNQYQKQTAHLKGSTQS